MDNLDKVLDKLNAKIGGELTEDKRAQFKKRMIDGKGLADYRNDIMQEFCAMLNKDYCLRPCLAVIQVGDDYASSKYVNNKIKACEKIGILGKHVLLADDISQEQLLNLITSLNKSDEVHGIMVQLPLPKGLDEKAILNSIAPEKDVDGFHPLNAGRLYTGDKPIGKLPCTAAGVIELIKSTGEEIAGKKAVVLGRSNIVGRPVAALLEQENATVTVCHSKTQSAELALAVRSADIIVSAIGKPNYLRLGLLGMNQTIIDVGINQDQDGKMCGDVDFKDAIIFARHITPVPGGVGPMTVSMLMENTIRCAMEQSYIEEDLIFMKQSDIKTPHSFKKFLEEVCGRHKYRTYNDMLVEILDGTIFISSDRNREDDNKYRNYQVPVSNALKAEDIEVICKELGVVFDNLDA